MSIPFLDNLQAKSVIIEAQNWGSIAYFYILNNTQNLTIDGMENFVKSSYRNRYEVCGPNGKKTLSVYVEKGRSKRRSTKKVGVFYGEDWQRQHWNTLCSNYRRSPYFEYYEDDLYPLFEQKFDSIYDFNLATIEFIKESLGLTFTYTINTQGVKHQDENYLDLRSFIRPNKPLPTELSAINDRKYHQVFEDRHPFFANLSILDALFNLGPRTVSLLE